MKPVTRIIVERGNKKYELLLSRNCTRHCSFVQHGPYVPCNNGCYLPMWFQRLYKKIVFNGFACLREIEIGNQKVPRGTKKASPTTKTKRKN